jgi:hypothetical protein
MTAIFGQKFLAATATQIVPIPAINVNEDGITIKIIPNTRNVFAHHLFFGIAILLKNS